jgi:hypothetical protein
MGGASFRRSTLRGEPESPLTVEEIKEKFILLTRDVLEKRTKRSTIW